MKRKLGELFDFIGYKLRVCKNECDDCNECFFHEYQLGCSRKEVHSVTGDCNFVIFKEIKEKS